MVEHNAANVTVELSRVYENEDEIEKMVSEAVEDAGIKVDHCNVTRLKYHE